MAQYFFHLRDGHDTLIDTEGKLIGDMAAVASLALKEARALISHDALTGKINLAQRIDVETLGGKLIHTLAFEDAVEIERGR